MTIYWHYESKNWSQIFLFCSSSNAFTKHLCTTNQSVGANNILTTLIEAGQTSWTGKNIHASLLCIGDNIKIGHEDAQPHHPILSQFATQQMLSWSDLNNKKCKNKIRKINIQNFGALSNSKSVYSSASGSTSVEKGRALIWDLSKRLTWKEWKLLQRVQNPQEGIMQDPELLYHQKALQWLNNYTSRVLREYSQNDRHSLHTHFKTKKGRKR